MKPNLKILEVHVTPQDDVICAINLPVLPPGRDKREIVLYFGLVLADTIGHIMDGLQEREVIHPNERLLAQKALMRTIQEELDKPSGHRRGSFQS